MNNIWESIKKPFLWLGAALAVILVLFRLRDKAASLDAREALLDTENAQTKTDVNVEANREKAKVTEEVALANQEAAASKAKEDVEDFYKGRK